jgi:hypothetical protein
MDMEVHLGDKNLKRKYVATMFDIIAPGYNSFTYNQRRCFRDSWNYSSDALRGAANGELHLRSRSGGHPAQFAASLASRSLRIPSPAARRCWRTGGFRTIPYFGRGMDVSGCSDSSASLDSLWRTVSQQVAIVISAA